jgi:hypothetical protein
MNQRELDRQVAQATGESVHLIRHRGFQEIKPIAIGELACTDSRPPMVVDWDSLETERCHDKLETAHVPAKVA